MAEAEEPRVRIEIDDEARPATKIRVATAGGQSQERPADESERPRRRLPAPPLTIALIVLCAGVTVIVNFAPSMRLFSVLAPSAAFVWHGAVWGLLTSAFVHKEIWHLGFNMWWARDFGRLLEPTLGKGRYLAFIAGAAIVGSGWELLFSAHMGTGGFSASTGIGFSGVVYAFFGYVAARRRSSSLYAAFLTGRTIRWMLGWLILCVVLTFANVLSVANTAHVSGLAFGFLVGLVAERRPARTRAALGVAVLAIGAILPVTYLPWSAAWRARKALYVREAYVDGIHHEDPYALAQMGSLFARTSENRAEGVAMLRESAAAGDVEGMSALAWVLATCKDPSVRSGEEAVQWAEKAHTRSQAAAVTDTLAGAYAEAGRWDEALAASRQAIAHLTPESTASQREQLEEHLSLIEKRQPIRE